MKNEPLSTRQREVLQVLLNKNEPIVMESLFSPYHIGEKTMRNDLKAIEDWLDGRQVQLRREGGRVSLEASKQRVREIWQELNRTQADFLGKRERVNYLTNRLILSTHPVTSTVLCGEIGVSKPTFLADMGIVGGELKQKNLSLKSRKGLGYWVEGNEVLLRGEMRKSLSRLLCKNGISNILDLLEPPENLRDKMDEFLRRVFQDVDLQRLRMVLSEWSRMQDIGLDSFPLMITLLVQLQRIRSGHLLTGEGLLAAELFTFPAIGQLGNLVEQYYGIPLKSAEQQYLSHTLLEQGFYLRSVPLTELPDLESVVEDMLRILQRDSLHRYRMDNALRFDLEEYLKFVICRQQAGVACYDSFYVRTKITYPYLYLQAEEMSAVFEKRTGVTMTQDEIGNLTLLISSHEALEKKCWRAAVVSDRSEFITRALCRRLKDSIPELEITQVLSPLDYLERQGERWEIDFFISTLPLAKEEKLVFCVTPILDYEEIQYIRDFMGGVKTIGTKKTGEFPHQQDGRLPSGETELVKETYSRNLATVLAILNELVHRAESECGCSLNPDRLLGLAIHLSLNMVLWENTGVYEDCELSALEGEDHKLVEIVYDFLDRISEVIGYTLPRSEAIAIIQYFKHQPY